MNKVKTIIFFITTTLNFAHTGSEINHKRDTFGKLMDYNMNPKNTERSVLLLAMPTKILALVRLEQGYQQ